MKDEDEKKIYRIWEREDYVKKEEYGMYVKKKIIKFMEKLNKIKFEFKKMDKEDINEF